LRAGCVVATILEQTITAKEILMWFRTLFDSTKQRRSGTPLRRTPRPPTTSRLRVEALEDRCMPSFLGPVNYPVGRAPDAIVAADFNLDGLQDLAVANHDNGTLSVLLANRDGTFHLVRTYSVGSNPTSLAVGDFNADGNPDVAVTWDRGVEVLLGNGDGTFSYAPPPPGLGFGWDPEGVAVGDFNGDGKLDLAVTSNIFVIEGYDDWGNPYGHSEGYANVLLGHGDGSFSSPTTTGLGVGDYHSVAVADFNGDGFADFATVNTNGGEVLVLLNDGRGSLLPPTYFLPNSLNPASVVAGDVNGDKKVDLVTVNQFDVSVLLGDGAGGFGNARTYGAVNYAQVVALGDFNHDGHLDIATAGQDGVIVLPGRGDGTFSEQLSAAAGAYPLGLAVGDFNGDGWLDAATANNSGNDISVLINAKDWSTTPQAASLAVSGFPSSTTAGVAGSFTVTAKNTDGTTATGYTGTVHFSSSDGKASLPANYTFTAADAGVHTFSVTLKTAGTQSIAVTDTTTASLTGTDGGITVKPGAASRFLTRAPSSVTAGVPFSLTITVQDAYGNVVTSYTGTIHFKSTDTTATLPANYTFTAPDKGVHTFTGLVLRKKGTQMITLTDTLNSSLTGSVIENVL
jgi:hypothetical protein